MDQVLRDGPTARPDAEVFRGSLPRLGHLGIGVSDLTRSLGFYCDLLGFSLLDEYLQTASPTGRDIYGEDDLRRRVAILRVDPVGGAFLVLSQQLGVAPTPPVAWDKVGIHHFALWVDDLDDRVRRLEQAGVPFLSPPSDFSGPWWAEPEGVVVRSAIFQDPDGIYVQLDQRVRDVRDPG